MAVADGEFGGAVFGWGVRLVGVAAVAVPSVLGLLQVGSEFTKVGKEGFDRFLGVIRVPQQWREEMKLVDYVGDFGDAVFAVVAVAGVF